MASPMLSATRTKIWALFSQPCRVVIVSHAFPTILMGSLVAASICIRLVGGP